MVPTHQVDALTTALEGDRPGPLKAVRPMDRHVDDTAGAAPMRFAGSCALWGARHPTGRTSGTANPGQSMVFVVPDTVLPVGPPAGRMAGITRRRGPGPGV